MTDLVVAGGTVLAPGGPARSEVIISAGRIVSVDPNVGTTGTGQGGTGGRNEDGTVGAGAERSMVGAPAQDDAVMVVGEPSPAAGGGPGPGPGATPARLDATNLLVAPGFVDLQCNGAVGVDLTTEPERLWEVAAALPRWGVTAWLPTVVTAPPSVRRRALAALRASPAAGRPPGDPVAATPLGLHLEGPFLARERKGAHDIRYIVDPSADVVDGEGWSRDAGVALVTLAPELPRALEVVRSLVDRGVVVSAGHSSATADQAAAAVEAGATYVTHLFNAMAPLHHRAPGLAGLALTDERVRVGVIVDGLHVDPAVVAVVSRALGDRLSLVTDAVAALGMPPGPIRLGELTATVSAADGAVRLADGTLAGSTLSLDRALRNLVTFAGVPLVDAVGTVTATPAAVLGLPDRGVVAPGAVGDLVLLTDTGEVVATVVGGEVAYDRRAAA
jgi:N-acetylglucosamine-6-phosphate deacetylase